MTFWNFPIVPVVVAITLIGFAFALVRYFLLPANGLGSTLEDVVRQVDAARAAGERDLTACFAGDARLAAIWQGIPRDAAHAEGARPRDRRAGGDRGALYHAGRDLPLAALSHRRERPHRVLQAPARDFHRHWDHRHILRSAEGPLGVSDLRDAGVVRNSLTSLLHGVSEAFAVSAFAILLAMVATVIEKYRLNGLYGKLGRLNHAVDAPMRPARARSTLHASSRHRRSLPARRAS